MTHTAVLFGSPYLRPRRLLPLLVATGVLGLGWLYVSGIVGERLPHRIGLLLFLGVPALVPIVAVGVLAYRGEGILLGWVVGAAFVFGPVVLLFYDGLQKEVSMGGSWGTMEAVELVLGGVLWSSLFALVFGIVGLVLGGGLRLLFRRPQS